MGLFEHCEIMLEKGLIDQETFGAIFSYRLYNIVGNEKIIKAKLFDKKAKWKNFIRLLRRLDLAIPEA